MSDFKNFVVEKKNGSMSFRQKKKFENGLEM
jgi:hypothetical protein